MNKTVHFNDFEVGYDIPAAVGIEEKDIQTPYLILDLDALEPNIRKMGQFAKDKGVRHRNHGKCTNPSTWPGSRKRWVAPAVFAARRSAVPNPPSAAVSGTSCSPTKYANRPAASSYSTLSLAP